MPVQQFTVNVRSRVDRALRRDLVRSAIAANRLTAATLRAQLATRRLGASQRFLARRLAYTARAFRTTRAAMFGFGTVLTGFAGYSIIRAIDNITRLENRLRTAGIGGEEANRVIDHLNDTANETGGNIAQLAAIFGRFVFSLKDTTATTDEVVIAVRSLARSATAMGITAQEARGGLIQLSQGLASGRLQGEELRSVLETIPTFARQLSTTIGVSYGQIREEARLGRISIQQMRQAFVDFEKTANAQFANFRLPIFGAISALFNELGRLIEEIARRLGAKEGISGAIQSLTQIVKNMRLALDDATSSFSKFFGVIIVGVQGAFRTLVAFIEEFLFFAQEAFLRLELVLQGLIASIRSAFEGDFAGAINTLEATFNVGVQSFVSGFDNTTKAAKGTAAAIRNVLKYGYKFGERRNIVATPLPKTPPPVPNLPLIQRARELVGTVNQTADDIGDAQSRLLGSISNVFSGIQEELQNSIEGGYERVDELGEVINELLGVSQKLNAAVVAAAEAPADQIAATTKELTKEIKVAEKALKRFRDERDKTDKERRDFIREEREAFNRFVGNAANIGAQVVGGQGSALATTTGNVVQGALQGGAFGGPVGAGLAIYQAAQERAKALVAEFDNLTTEVDDLNSEYNLQVGIQARARQVLATTTRGTDEYRETLKKLSDSTLRLNEIEQKRSPLQAKLNDIDEDAVKAARKQVEQQKKLEEALNKLLDAILTFTDSIGVQGGIELFSFAGRAASAGGKAAGGFFEGVADGVGGIVDGIGSLIKGDDFSAPIRREQQRRRERIERDAATRGYLQTAERQLGELVGPRSAIAGPLKALIERNKEIISFLGREGTLENFSRASSKELQDQARREFGFSDPEVLNVIGEYLKNPFQELSKEQLDTLHRIAFGVEEEVDKSNDILDQLRKNQESLEFLLAERDRRNAVLRAQLAEERRLEGERRERAVSAVGGATPATPITINNLINGGMLVDEINSGAGEAAILNVINSNREQVRDVLASAS